MYKLVALDLDGTLLRSDSTLSEYTSQVLRRIEEKGVKVVLCTGRIYEGVLRYARMIGLNNPGVFCNGAQLRNSLDGRILDECLLDKDAAALAIRISAENGGHPRVYMDGKIYVSVVSEEDEAYSSLTKVPIKGVGPLYSLIADRDPLKLIALMPDRESVFRLLELSRDAFGDSVYCTRSLFNFVEFMNRDATKGKALNNLARRWGIAREEIVVAGDHINDLTMFEEAGLSLAPANAEPEVLRKASLICASNDEDGIARKLDELFLAGRG